MEFTKKAFTPEMKVRMNELIDNLMAALKGRIQNLDWMSDTTKQQALLKLAAFKRKIGYPDVLRGYKGVKIDDSYASNILRVNQFEIRRNFEDLGKPRDKTRWGIHTAYRKCLVQPDQQRHHLPGGHFAAAVLQRRSRRRDQLRRRSAG